MRRLCARLDALADGHNAPPPATRAASPGGAIRIQACPLGAPTHDGATGLGELVALHVTRQTPRAGGDEAAALGPPGGPLVNACANGAHVIASGQISVSLIASSITGGADGLLTEQNSSSDTGIFVDAATTVLGGNNGIEARGAGAGFIGLTIDGQVTGQAGDGLVVMQSGSGAVSLITDAGSNIRTLTPASSYGIYLSSATGGIALSLGGTSSEGGVYLSTGGSAGTQATINGAINNTVGAGLTLRSGTGNLNVNVNSTITATTGAGVDAASPAANPFVGVGAGGAVTGTSGVLLAGSGTGTTLFNNSGAVTGSSGVGVSVTSSAGDAQLLNLAGGHIVAPGTAASSATLAAAASVGTATISNDGLTQVSLTRRGLWPRRQLRPAHRGLGHRRRPGSAQQR